MSETNAPPAEQLYPDRRKLTDADISALVSAVRKSQDKADLRHPCRFDEITPEDLREMVEAHKRFNIAMTDSKAIVRRFFIVLILTGISGYAIYGWWGKLIDTVQKSVRGGQ